MDPDDQTPGAIKESGAEVVTYGAPVLPGAMFCLAYFSDGTPVMGLPGCVMYAKTTIFDLVLPRIAAGVPDLQEGYYQAWKWRIVSGLRGMPLAGLRLWDRLNADRERDELTVLE